jgi:tetratricopeptide (TPR) repeat protein
LEPNFARALAGLADMGTIRRGGSGGHLAQREEIVAQAERAIALDPTLAEPHATLGLLEFFSDWDFDAADRYFQQAVERNPSYAWAHLWRGQSLMTQGRVEEAMAENQRALEADPLAPRIASNTALLLLLASRPADALAAADRSLSLLPGETQAQTWKTEALLMLGREAEALKIVREALAIDPQRRDFTYVLARAGTPEERAAAVAAPDPRFANRTRSLLAVGRVDEALAGLEADARDSVFSFQFVLFHPAFDGVRKDPRFVKMLENLRMTQAHERAQAWRAANPPHGKGAG